MPTPLTLKDYRNDIHISDPYLSPSIKGAKKEELVELLLNALKINLESYYSYKDKRRMLHAAQNTMQPFVLDNVQKKWLNQLLQLESNEKTITSTRDLIALSDLNIGETSIKIWQGDITTLSTDAIVNAANNQLLGCWQPLHTCIDNAIHTAAGIQLREDCEVIMKKQGFAEPTGLAKITRAYNLPSKYVLHTVGPIVQGRVSPQHQQLLAKAYTSCLKQAAEIKEIRSIAFCGISSGVFGYPVTEAAQVALNTVKRWIENHPKRFDLVVFNVFKDYDKEVYKH